MFLKIWYQKFQQILGIKDNFKDMLKSIMDGNYVIEHDNNKLNRMFHSTISELEVQQKIYLAKHHLERVLFVEKDFPISKFQEFLNELDKMFEKSEKIGKIFEERGHDYFDAFKFTKAFRCFNLATLFTPGKCENSDTDSDSLSGYFIYNTNNKMKISHIEDIELPFNHTCPEELKPKLLLMYKKYNIPNNGKPKQLTLEVLKLKKYRNKNVFKVYGMKNPKFLSGSDCIRMKINKNKGRHLVTDSELSPGTTVIVEDPYICVLNETTKWDTTHCSKCLKKIQIIIPCNTCVFVSYCSNKCRLEDLEEGHKYECPCYPYLHAIRISPNLHLCLKVICKEGPENIYKRWIVSLNESTEEKSEADYTGINKDTMTYDSNSYHQLLYLKSHLDEETLASLTWIGVSIVKTLEYKTKFFLHNKNFDNKDFKNYVASLFLFHGVSIPYNSISLSEEVQIEVNGSSGKQITSERMGFATGVYPLISIMCHSCDPNVFRQSLPNGKLAIITNRGLNPGDELQFSYGFSYTVDKLEERRSIISKRYHFICECDACVHQWPIFNEMNRHNKYLCPNCSKHFKDSKIIQIKQCVLNHINDVGLCGNCKTGRKFNELIDEADKFEKLLKKADRFISNNKPLDAIPLLIDIINFFQSNICPPTKSMILAQLMLFESFTLITNA